MLHVQPDPMSLNLKLHVFHVHLDLFPAKKVFYRVASVKTEHSLSKAPQCVPIALLGGLPSRVSHLEQHLAPRVRSVQQIHRPGNLNAAPAVQESFRIPQLSKNASNAQRGPSTVILLSHHVRVALQENILLLPVPPSVKSVQLDLSPIRTGLLLALSAVQVLLNRILEQHLALCVLLELLRVHLDSSYAWIASRVSSQIKAGRPNALAVSQARPSIVPVMYCVHVVSREPTPAHVVNQSVFHAPKERIRRVQELPRACPALPEVLAQLQELQVVRSVQLGGFLQVQVPVNVYHRAKPAVSLDRRDFPVVLCVQRVSFDRHHTP